MAISIGNTIGRLQSEPKPKGSVEAGSANPPEKKSWWSKWGDVVHTGLDILGAVPVIGAFADGANAAIYAAEGNYTEAAISAASAAANLVPGGGAVMKAGKAAVAVGKAVGKKVIKKVVSEGVEQAAKKVAAKAVKAAKGAKNFVSNVGGGIKSRFKKCNPCKMKPGVGKPVNPVLGIKFLADEEDLDFDLPSPLPLPWQRSYFSDQIGNGWLGQGWSLPICARLIRRHNNLVFIDEQGREIELPELDEGERDYNRYEEFFWSREANGRYRIGSVDGGLHYLFAPLTLDEYDPSGERAGYLPLVAMEDRNGNRIRLIYNDAGQPVHIHDAAGRILGLHFIPIALPNGRQAWRLRGVAQLHGEPGENGMWPQQQVEALVFYDYSAEGDLIRVQNAAGSTLREYRYKNHILVEHNQPGALVAQYEYDQYTPQGKVVRHTTNLAQTWTFDYRPGETVVTDPLGRCTRYQFNADQELTGLIDAAGRLTRIELDAWGKPIRITDPLGRATRYAYDASGNTSAIIDATGARTEVQYHAQWRLPTAITDAMGATARYDYDALGNLIRETDALGQQTEYNHDERGLVVRITDAKGGRQHLDYDASGQPLSHTDCSGRATRYEWDAHGHLQSVVNAASAQTHYRHDLKGRLLSIRHADGASEQFSYDAHGRLIGHSDPLGAKTAWELDADGLPRARIDATGQQLRYQYDAARRLVVLANENDAYYRFAYDTSDNLTGEQGFDGRVTHYAYDAADQLIEKRELGTQSGPGVTIPEDDTPEALRTSYRRDKLGRLIEKTTGRAKDKRTQRTRYSYDALGRLTQARNEGGRIELAYDALGQLTQESSHIRGRDHTLAHAYDTLGNRVQTVLPDGRTLNHLYYGSGHLHQINLDGELISDIERDVAHREISRTQGQLTSHYQYDAMGRLTDQQAMKTAVGHTSAPAVLRQYQYDSAGNLTNLFDQRFGAIAYQYDVLGRIRAANQERFAFDPAHNLLDSARNTPAPASNGSAGAIKNNRLTVFEDKRYAYDTHGNLTEKRIGAHTRIQLEYDPEHQLEHAIVARKGSEQRVEYGYDAFGRRAFKKDTFGTTTFVWDGNRLFAETRGARTITYLYEPDSFVPLAQIENHATAANEDEKPAADIHYYHNDQIGTPHELSNADGRIEWRASYKVWGNTVTVEYPELDIARAQQPDTIHQPLRFQGQYYDTETGLHYNRFRYYDPDVGRFVTQDPIGLDGGDNLYQYAPNPAGWIDPHGLVKLRPTDPTKGSLSNIETRCWYLREEEGILSQIDCTKSLKQQARKASQLRNQARIRARLLMKDRQKAIDLYKTDPMLTFKDLVRKKQTKGLKGNDAYKDIIGSSKKSRESVNKSLLEGIDCNDVLSKLGI